MTKNKKLTYVKLRILIQDAGCYKYGEGKRLYVEIVIFLYLVISPQWSSEYFDDQAPWSFFLNSY